MPEFAPDFTTDGFSELPKAKKEQKKKGSGKRGLKEKRENFIIIGYTFYSNCKSLFIIIICIHIVIPKTNL